MTFTSIYTLALSILSLGLIALVAACAYALISHSVQAARLRNLIGPRAKFGAFALALSGTIGSIIYSDVIGFPPCTLCLWQRSFLYPQAIFLGLGWKFPDFKAERFALPLSAIGGSIALYHSYSQIWGSSLLSCTAEGGDCSRVYFIEFGFITLPFMSFMTFISIIALLSVGRAHRRAAVRDLDLPRPTGFI